MIIQCKVCLKNEDLCLCSQIQPTDSRLQVLILQHPQEPDSDLGTGKLTQLALSKATLRVGLSWPNLKVALGKPEAQSARWAVLYLGSGVKEPLKTKTRPTTPQALQFVSRQGNQVQAPSFSELDGIVVLDGTWSQAKALWWRNAWLLKLKRIVISPQQKSLYGALRKEPRRECLSTLESTALCLTSLGEPPEVAQKLTGIFMNLLDLYKKRPKKQSATQQNAVEA